MASKSASILFVTFALILASHMSDASPRARCNDDQLDEAQKAFRNCVDSAKAGIVTRHAAQPEIEESVAEKTVEKRDVSPALCDDLETMLSGCDKEVTALSKCKGQRHVNNLKAIHLSSIADVLRALNDGLKVEECPVFSHNMQQQQQQLSFNADLEEDTEDESDDVTEHDGDVVFGDNPGAKDFHRSMDHISKASSVMTSSVLLLLSGITIFFV